MSHDKLVCGHSAKLLDQALIKKFRLTESALMAAVGSSAFRTISEEFPGYNSFDIFCGPGKNGSDGLNIAKYARSVGCSVRIYILNQNAIKKALHLPTFEECRELGISIQSFKEFSLREAIIVDAIFGIGINRSLSQEVEDTLTIINETPNPKVAIDVPTGVDPSTGKIEAIAFRAHLTISFFAGKQGTFTCKGRSYSGKVLIDKLSIVVRDELKRFHSSKLEDLESLKYLFPARQEYSSKVDFGHCLIVGGAPGFAGASLLAAQAALRTGSGLVSLAAHFSNSEGLISSQPEIMLHKIKDAKDMDKILDRASVVGIGPGLGLSTWSRQIYKKILKLNKPMVFDADALNLLAEQPNCNDCRILTPHAKEAGRLLGVTDIEIESDRFSSAERIAETFGGVCLLKGPGTVVAGMGRTTRVIDGGNCGMATGGMGDLLTGIIVSLVGQGATVFEAATLGASIHNRAADKAKNDGLRGMVPSDLLPIIRDLVK